MFDCAAHDQMDQTDDTTASTGKDCPECGKHIPNPRRNQTYCSKACRKAATDRQKHRNTERHKYQHSCNWCGTEFESERHDAQFCSKECQQGFNNFWKGKGPQLAKALLNWRVDRKKGSMSELCHTFSLAREDEKDAKAKAKATQKKKQEKDQ